MAQNWFQNPCPLKRKRSDEDEPYDPSDYSKDGYIKDQVVKQLSDELNNYKKFYKKANQQVVDLQLKMQDMSGQMADMKKQVDRLKADEKDYTRKKKGISDYIQTMTAKEKAWKKDIEVLTDRNKSQNLELAEKIKLCDIQVSLIAKHKAELKKTQLTIEELNKEIRRLNIKSLNDLRFGQLREQVEDKYKELYKKSTAELADKEKQLKKLKDEIVSLKKQRKYFEDNNDRNKQQLLGAVHTVVKTHEMYANSVRQVAKDGIAVTNEMGANIIEAVTKVMAEATRSHITRLSGVIQDNMDRVEQIEAAEKRICEKRADGRLNCGSCEKSFASSGDLKHHMTVTHRINNEKRHNHIPNIEVIQLEDD